MATAEKQKFNDDLLGGQADRDLARISFPLLTLLLDFPELREAFSAHDQPANALKKKRRDLGVAAITMGVLALAGAASGPLMTHVGGGWSTLVGVLSAIFGIASIVVGGLGVFSSKSKEAWLHHRLMTERLRQFHFQMLVFRMPEALNALDNPSAMDAFLEDRRARLAAIGLEYEGHETSKLKAVFDDSDESEFQLVEPSPIFTEAAPSTLAAYLQAYRVLRFGHQIQYANWMLRRETAVFPSSAAGQFRLLRAVAISCMAFIFALHLFLAVSLILNGAAPGDLVDVVVVWLAIIMMATRAFEEGAQPGREIERYSNYRATLKRLLRMFDATDDVKEKHRLMIETERTVYQEMRAFLLLHEDARFVL